MRPRLVPALFRLAMIGLLLVLSSNAALSVGQANLSQYSIDEKRREFFRAAERLLRKQKVAFNPLILLDTDWREQLAPYVAQMPDMELTRREVEPLAGVYFARTLLLPETITVKGDTVIIVEEIFPDDENTEITITGDHVLYIFCIGDERRLRQRSKRWPIATLNIKLNAPIWMAGLNHAFRSRRQGRGWSISQP